MAGILVGADWYFCQIHNGQRGLVIWRMGGAGLVRSIVEVGRIYMKVINTVDQRLVIALTKLRLQRAKDSAHDGLARKTYSVLRPLGKDAPRPIDGVENN